MGALKLPKTVPFETKRKIVSFLPRFIAEVFPFPMNVPWFTNPKYAARLFFAVTANSSGLLVEYATKESGILVMWGDVLSILEREKGMVMTTSTAIGLCWKRGAEENQRHKLPDLNVKVRRQDEPEVKRMQDKAPVVKEITERDLRER